MLKNLNELALEAKKNRKNYINREIKLSDKFKEEYVRLNPDTKIVFYDYTAVVTSDKFLDTIIPNQWFVIASFFVDFFDSLLEYKDIITSKLLFSDEKIKKFKKEKALDTESISEIENSYSQQDKELLIKFLSDYDWWFGSKTIDRGDFYHSPILSLANVVNLNQAYIASITSILSRHKSLLNLLDNEEFLGESVSISNSSLRKIIFESFKLLLEKYGEGKALEGYEEKESTINGKKFKGIFIRKYFGTDNLIGIFEELQTLEDLKSSRTIRFINENITVLGEQYSYFTTQWNNKDGRGLSLLNYNKYLSVISSNSIKIVLEDGIFKLVVDGQVQAEKSINFDNSNTIYYGPPGTGKSHKVDKIIDILNHDFYERVTFHPEYDNASFVGSYKPATDSGNNIVYEFVPQAFTEIYKRAWKGLQNGEQYYLIIEEINRGNCAEIFGEIFQLLDRNSNYTVSPSTDLKKHLEKELGKDHEGIIKGLKLPPNLAILATMNTSDQSLFPMDAAFKRRWDWEYIRICYEPVNQDDKPNDSFNYKIHFEIQNDAGKEPFEADWIKFIKGINKIISAHPGLGMDKNIGNYFVKPSAKDSEIITLKQFVNKVVFYLWNDVFKDEENTIFSENGLTYESFFPLETNGAGNSKLIIEKYSNIEKEN